MTTPCLAFGPDGARCAFPVHGPSRPHCSVDPLSESVIARLAAPLVEWTDGLRLDLGSGVNPAGTVVVPNGPEVPFLGVDLYVPCSPRVIGVDLFSYPLPWHSGTVDAIWCSHFVEHLPPNWHNERAADPLREWRYPFYDFMTEIDRILKPGATATFVHPYLKSERAFQDMTHNRFIPATAWIYMDRAWRVANGLDHYPYPDTHMTVAALEVPEPHDRFKGRPRASIDAMMEHAWETIPEIRVTLVKGDAPAPVVEPVVTVEQTGA